MLLTAFKTKSPQPTYFMGVILLSPALKKKKQKKKQKRFSETTKTLNMTSILRANISLRVPKSKRCSTLSRLAPGGLLKKYGALYLPN